MLTTKTSNTLIDIINAIGHESAHLLSDVLGGTHIYLSENNLKDDDLLPVVIGKDTATKLFKSPGTGSLSIPRNAKRHNDLLQAELERQGRLVLAITR